MDESEHGSQVLGTRVWMATLDDTQLHWISSMPRVVQES